MTAHIRTGLCIGGPADGETRDRDSELLVVIERQTIPMVYGFSEKIPDTVSELKRVAYRFEPFRVTIANPALYDVETIGYEWFGFWIVHGMTTGDAMRRMMAVYAKATNMTFEDTREIARRIAGKLGGKGSVLPIKGV